MNQKITPKMRLLAWTKIASSIASRAPVPCTVGLDSSSSLPRRRASSRSCRSSARDVVVHLVLEVARAEREQQRQHDERELQQAEQVRFERVRDDEPTGSTGSATSDDGDEQHDRPRAAAECAVGRVEVRVEPAPLAQVQQVRESAFADEREQEREQAHAIGARSSSNRTRARSRGQSNASARVGLAAGRDVAVTDDAVGGQRRVGAAQQRDHPTEHRVLRGFVRIVRRCPRARCRSRNRCSARGPARTTPRHARRVARTARTARVRRRAGSAGATRPGDRRRRRSTGARPAAARCRTSGRSTARRTRRAAG